MNGKTINENDKSVGIIKNIHDPATTAARTVQSIERGKETHKSLSLGIEGLEGYVMARPNKVNGLLADTSQGKTSVMGIMARNFASQLKDDEVGVFVTWEDTVEDFSMNDIANLSKIPLASLYHGDVKEYQFKAMLRAAADRASSPLWIIGQSETVEGVHPRMTMTDIVEAVNYISNQKKVVFTFFDYLQRIGRQDSKERDTRMQYSGLMDAVKEYTLGFHTATFIASQVTRGNVEKTKWRQPQTHWAMETANFEHTCDGMLSLWYVHKSKDAYKIGDPLGDDLFVTEDVMLIEILKQKKARTGDLIALDFIPEYNMLVPYNKGDEVRKQILEEGRNIQ